MRAIINGGITLEAVIRLVGEIVRNTLKYAHQIGNFSSLN
jgi:hypothetical protein